MRVLQLIDTLRPGGAERMAVSYANALVSRTDKSYLCVTRSEGLLRRQLYPEVGYLFLEKRSSADLRSFLRLRHFVRTNRIDLLQAHSSSWFLALIVKWSLPGLRLVWHDHYGLELRDREPGILKLASKYFDGIFSVNIGLKNWAEQKLASNKAHYLKNFLPTIKATSSESCILLGEGFKIICVANLRTQKDHLNLLRAFDLLSVKYPGISLHLVGGEESPAYAAEIKDFILTIRLNEKVFLYGTQSNIPNLLIQADLGVLSSTSEGLPVALLEYASAGLPVVCTKVGECAEVIGAYGKLVPPKDPIALAEAIGSYIEQKEEREQAGKKLQEKISTEYSEEAVLQKVVKIFRGIISVRSSKN